MTKKTTTYIVQRKLRTIAKPYRWVWCDYYEFVKKSPAASVMRYSLKVDTHKHRIVKRNTTIHDTIED